MRPPAGELSFFERFAKERTTQPAAKWVMDFMIYIDGKADLFGEAAGEPLLEIMFLGVVPEAGRRGAGFGVCAESVAVARQIGARGVCAIWTSNYSAAIGRRLGFQVSGGVAIPTAQSPDYVFALSHRSHPTISPCLQVLAVVEHSELLIDGRPSNELLAAHQQRSQLVLLKLG